MNTSTSSTPSESSSTPSAQASGISNDEVLDGSGRAWRVYEAGAAERQRAQALSAELNVHPLVTHLLTLRGLEEVEEMRAFLNASLQSLPDPTLLMDCDRAARRLLDALEGGERIVIYGDYDVDGVTSSALIWRYFQEAFGVDLEIYIPLRLTEGYGLNADAVRQIADVGARLLVTVDNGSSAYEEVKLAHELGLDVIIIDHHTVSDPEPPAFAHLNPHRQSCQYPDQRLAAVGVAFMLLIHLRRITRGDPRFARARQPNLSHLLDIVALGTVADVAPLRGVNRALVRTGIERIKQAPRPGISALAQVARAEISQFSAHDIGYKVGPRLNAAGRIDDARCGLQLLISDDPQHTRRVAARVEQFNQERRSLQDQILREALAQAEQYARDPVIIVSSPEWHHGVVGIVASRLVETFHRPAVVLGGDETQGDLKLKGSARSVPHLNFKAALDRCAEHLISYGGHAAAAGMSLKPDQLEGLRASLIKALESADAELFERPPLIADAELNISEIDGSLLDQLSALEPLGHGNPKPLFVSLGVRARVSTLSQGKHLKLHFDLPPQRPAEAIGWGMGHLASDCDGLIDICYQPRWDHFRGVDKIVLMLKGVRAHNSTLPSISVSLSSNAT